MAVLSDVNTAVHFSTHTSPCIVVIYVCQSYPLFNGVDQSLLPSLTFATCSSDATVRFWNLEQPSATGNKRVHRNIYSKVSTMLTFYWALQRV